MLDLAGDAVTDETTLTNSQLTLFRENSVVGRSVVIRRTDTSAWACADISYPSGTNEVVAIFKSSEGTANIEGTIIFTQGADEPAGETTILPSLSYDDLSSQATTNRQWFIYAQPIPVMDACASLTGGVYDPYVLTLTVQVRNDCICGCHGVGIWPVYRIDHLCKLAWEICAIRSDIVGLRHFVFLAGENAPALQNMVGQFPLLHTGQR